MAVTKDLPALSQFANLDKKVQKLNQIWTKFKTTPPSIAFLVKDLSLLVHALPVDAKNIGATRFIPPVVVAVQQCNCAAQNLLDISGKYTSKFNRKALSGEHLNHLELSFADLKIRLLLTQFLVERREASPSQAAVAEELAQLHARNIPRLSLEKTQTCVVEPKTDSLLSFRCYSELIGREKVLLDIDAEFETSDVVVIAGPGGVGKTQIAAEHSMRFQSRQLDSHLFWLDCESLHTFEASYRAIAEKLNLPGSEDYRVNILERTQKCLEQIKSGRCLIILQNVTPSSLDQIASAGKGGLCPSRFRTTFSSYLPNTKNCQILCISSDKASADHLPGTPAVFEISALYDHEATNLFQSKIPKELDLSSNISTLSKDLDYLPLAICQAAAYMVTTRCDAANYQKLLKSVVSRQQGSKELSSTVSNVSDACYKTTQISYSGIRKQNAKASDLLSVMATTNGRSIPKTLLWNAWKHGLSDLTALSCIPEFDISAKTCSMDGIPDGERTEHIEFAAALATLEAYLMVQYDALNETYSVHRMIRYAILSILDQQSTLSSWRSSAMVLFSSITHLFRQPIKQSAQVISTLMTHISEVAQHQHTTTGAGLAKAKILCDVASFKIWLFQSHDSTALLKDALKIQKSLLKGQDSRLLRTLVSLAESTSQSDSAAASIPLFVEAIAGFKQTLGPGNRRTLTAQLNLCSNYIANGDSEAASTVLYEVQAAASASLQILADDRKKIQQKVDYLKKTTGDNRQGKRSKSSSRVALGDDLQQKGRVSTLRKDRARTSIRSFSANNRVASLDSIVEMFEVEGVKSDYTLATNQFSPITT